MERIMITGAGRGIGKSLLLEGLERGYQIVATVRGPAQAKALPSNVEVLQLDVTDTDTLTRVAAELSGSIDVLVNNAGIIGPKRQSSLDMDFEGFIETLKINTIAPLAVTQAFLPHLKKSTGPKLIMISSQMGRLAYQKSDRIAYRASKAALNKVMQGLATDLFASGIAVQSLDPGWARTDMGGQEADISPQDSATGLMDRIEELTMANTGTFMNYAGETIDW